MRYFYKNFEDRNFIRYETCQRSGGNERLVLSDFNRFKRPSKILLKFDHESPYLNFGIEPGYLDIDPLKLKLYPVLTGQTKLTANNYLPVIDKESFELLADEPGTYCMKINNSGVMITSHESKTAIYDFYLEDVKTFNEESRFKLIGSLSYRNNGFKNFKFILTHKELEMPRNLSKKPVRKDNTAEHFYLNTEFEIVKLDHVDTFERENENFKNYLPLLRELIRKGLSLFYFPSGLDVSFKASIYSSFLLNNRSKFFDIRGFQPMEEFLHLPLNLILNDSLPNENLALSYNSDLHSYLINSHQIKFYSNRVRLQDLESLHLVKLEFQPVVGDFLIKFNLYIDLSYKISYLEVRKVYRVNRFRILESLSSLMTWFKHEAQEGLEN